MDKYRTVTLKKLKELCHEYDEEQGKFPESMWEGASVYCYIINKLENEKEKCELNITPK